MSSPRNQYPSSSFPIVPPSLSAGDHGMRDYYAEQEHTAERPAAHTLQHLTPYLGLRARLSQVWINRWTILILLVLARVLIAIGSLHNDIDSAKVQALSACSSVESMGSTMASLPHYMAQGTNELAAHGVEKAVDGLQEMLFMAITGVEEIFVFVVNMMYGTYECLITFAVGGAAHAAVAIAEDVTKFLNQTLGDIGKDIDNSIKGFDTDLNNFLNGLSGLGNAFGGKTTPPQIDLSKNLDALNHVTLPDSINEGLNKLNSSIPNFAQVQNFTNNVLRLPFEEVKKLLNESLGPFTFNQSVFPVPQREQLTFCSDDDGVNSFFEMLYTVADTARKVFIAVLLIAATLACVPMVFMEIRRWRTMQQRAALVTRNAIDPMDVVYIASRPYTSAAGLKLSRNFSSPRHQILTRWFVAYATSTPALLVLAVAMAGLFSCLCQYILLQAVKKEVPALASQVGAFADKVIDKLNNASSAWANGTNGAILAENNKINHDVFGWVNTSTSALNQTLNTFINETTGVIHKAFDGTVLEDPVQQIFNCLIGLKVASIEKGLTWIQDHAHIDFPLFPNDTFSAGASKSISDTNTQTGSNASGDSFLADPGSEASDKITAAVIALTDKLANGIRTEALISTAVLMVWVLVVLIGLTRVLILFCRRDKLRGEGGVSYAGDIDHSNNLPQQPSPVYQEDSRAISPLHAFHTGGSSHNNARYGQESGYVVGEKTPQVPAYEESGKVGFAGQREVWMGQRTGVRSEYGVLEDEKRGF